MGLNGWRLFSLVMAALLAGYAFATAASIFIVSILPMPRAEATLTGNLLSFLVYIGAIIWVFTVRRPRRAWLGLMIPACLLAGTGIVIAELVLPV